ncbi:thioredoxin family protein [Sediminibacillus halophilus]|uniref:Thiol-disulfide isomerase or thioredoxin n=1 Tax=Sediminibacillus halophilus TaxID=482461 RepID=A0A1G9QRW1_9BACI|nr:thioredoxin family protein [Sediminibacillus halophilus]SDM13015.1 Thiol-disulfide isomerase or thioredoxin [Sediminibacillus halophilus]
MNLEKWYQKGIGPDEYIESMQQHKENLLYVYDHFSLPENEPFFDKIAKENLRVIVLTEDWCGDAMMNVPILFHLAERSEMDIRLLARDQNLELMDQYLTNGKARSIPIFIFIDGKGQEVAKWGPRAPEVQQFIDESMANLPEKDAADYQEKRQEMFTFVTKSFRDNTDFWQQTCQSILSTLKQAI